MRRKAYRTLFISLCSMLLFSGCAVGPNYKRPEVAIPVSHRSDSALPAAGATAPAVTFGDLKWFDLFQDETLRELIKTALKDNYDVRIAAQRVLAAQAFVTIEKSALYPSVNAEANADVQQGVRRLLVRDSPAEGFSGSWISGAAFAARPRPPGPSTWPRKQFSRP